jgi:hypothetical protein
VDPNAPQDEAKDDRYGVFINKRPTKDQAKVTLDLVDKNAVKLDSSFKVSISGTLGLAKDGKTVILKNPKPVIDKNIPNDPAMVKFVQDWIIAVSDAGWLGYFKRIPPEPKNVIITVEQNDTDLIASVRADQPSENQARTSASSLNLLIAGAAALTKGDEQAFLQKAVVVPDGKNYVLNFSIPKQQAQEMIQRKLAEAKAPPAQPSSTAVISTENKSASR